MKTITIVFLVWLFAASCATVKTTADRSAKTSPPDPLSNLSRPSGTLSTGEGIRNGTFSEGAAQPATAGCATPPVYLNGNDEPVAYGLFLAEDKPATVVINHEHLAAPSPVERAGGEVYNTVACPVYYTGNNEPAASGFSLATDEPAEQEAPKQ
jgi:hypothetical protein